MLFAGTALLMINLAMFVHGLAPTLTLGYRKIFGVTIHEEFSICVLKLLFLSFCISVLWSVVCRCEKQKPFQEVLNQNIVGFVLSRLLYFHIKLNILSAFNLCEQNWLFY